MSNVNRLNSNSHLNTQQTNSIESDPFGDYEEGSYEDSYATDLEGQNAWETDSSPILTAGEYKQELFEQLKQVRGDTGLSAAEKKPAHSENQQALIGPQSSAQPIDSSRPDSR